MVHLGSRKVNTMWNYRIVKWVDDTYTDIEYFYEIREVYYDLDNVPYAHGTANAFSETTDGLHEVLDMMRLAFTKDVLCYPDDFTGDVNKQRDDNGA